MKNPPILVAVLGFFSALAGFGHLFFGLRILGFDWFGALGDVPALENIGLWGWLAVMTGIVWLLVAAGLWSLQPWARNFALIIAGFVLLEAVLAFFQFPGIRRGLRDGDMPATIIWYLMSKDVKVAFGVPNRRRHQRRRLSRRSRRYPSAAAPVAAAAFVAAEPVAAEPAPAAAAAVVAPAAAVEMAGRGAGTRVRRPHERGRRRGHRPGVGREARGNRHQDDG